MRVMRVAKAAKRFDVGKKTLRRWVESGKVKAYTPPGGPTLVDIGSVEEFLQVHVTDNEALDALAMEIMGGLTGGR